MKRRLSSAFLLIAFMLLASLLSGLLLAGCSSGPDWTLSLEAPEKFVSGREITLKLNVQEKNKPVTGLQVSAQLEMKKMDHGTVDVDFQEKGDGVYEGKTMLEMGGEWTAIVRLSDKQQQKESIASFSIQEVKEVGSINGEPITGEDLAFYRTINRLHIEISREKDRQRLKGAELEEANGFWDARDKEAALANSLLTQIIRLRAAALLAQEKGYAAAGAEVQRELDASQEQYERSVAAKQLISEYGEERFWAKEEARCRLMVLAKKVQTDMIARVKTENPQAGTREIALLAEKKYEELLVSQIGTLKIALN